MRIPAPDTGRAAADRCPGALRLVQAADGYLARVRLPGGFVWGEQLRVLARLAAELGDGRIELTSRGNVQLRALAPDAADALTAELTSAGLLPSLGHDRVRNIVASPLAGLGGGPELAPLVGALDAALCSRRGLAELPGRFLFAIDDGRGDVAGLGADVVAQLGPDGANVNGLAAADVVAVMLAFAEAFMDEREAHGGAAWRIADLPDGPESIRAVVAGRLGLDAAGAAPVAETPARPVGHIEGTNAAVLLAPLGRLDATQLGWLADRVTARPARITPWRSVVVPELTDVAAALAEAAGLGFGDDAGSPWLRVTACAGRPGCASALADVQADAATFAARWPERIVHVSGCARHCGRPAGTEIDVTATGQGYDVARS